MYFFIFFPSDNQSYVKRHSQTNSILKLKVQQLRYKKWYVLSRCLCGRTYKIITSWNFSINHCNSYEIQINHNTSSYVYFWDLYFNSVSGFDPSLTFPFFLFDLCRFYYISTLLPTRESDQKKQCFRGTRIGHDK